MGISEKAGTCDPFAPFVPAPPIPRPATASVSVGLQSPSMLRFDKWLTKVAADAPVDRVARRALTTRLRAVAWFLHAAGNGDNEAEAIHQLRIWTRRTAAALRLFAPVLTDKPARKLRKSLKKLRRAAGACPRLRRAVGATAGRRS